MVASDAARARAAGGLVAARPSKGPSGSLVLRADAEGIARSCWRRSLPQFGIPDALVPLFARPFDELRGSVATSTDGMKGKVSLTLD